MALFLFKKILILLLSLWAIITVTFFLMHALPGDPFLSDRPLPPELLRSLYAYYGLDRPLWHQYLDYLAHCVKGDLGLSIVYDGRSINQLIQETIPVSSRLGLQALFLAIPMGITLGSWAALRRGSWQDQCAIAIATLGISVPSFVLSTLLQYLFALKLPLCPIARWGTFAHTLLPSIALAAMPFAFITRLMRSSLIAVLQQDYIRTATTKGLSERVVLLRHAFRSALLPVISYLGPAAAHILTGSFAVEKIFAIPGIGQWMIHSIMMRDYPVIAGLSIFFSAILLVATFLVEVTYSLLDPRIRMRHG